MRAAPDKGLSIGRTVGRPNVLTTSILDEDDLRGRPVRGRREWDAMSSDEQADGREKRARWELRVEQEDRRCTSLSAQCLRRPFG
jgi:hypothetical protein